MINLNHLNEVQKQAVTDTEGAVLVFAGAGSGKTRVLTHRVAYLIEDKNVAPWNILAITFTNKATNEMKTRLNDMLGENNVWISTFHSLCVKILFKHAEEVGYKPNFTIYDDSATKKLVAKVLREKHIEDDKDSEGERMRRAISEAKNLGMTPTEYFYHIKHDRKDALLISEVYESYNDELKLNNAMDFDDLLINALRLFKENPTVLSYYRNRFKYIHVDEFQDTNEVQCEIVKTLAGENGNVFVVGDDDQSIYGWRGANVNNILEFGKVFANAKIYKLEENYRSTKAILDSANRLIKNNVTRSDKTLFTVKDGGARVEYITCVSDYNEVDRVMDIISSLKRFPHDYQNGDMVILVRNNALTRLFEINLGRMGQRYRVYGGFKFFDRKEILDLLAYLRLIVNPLDGDAVTRIINFPKRAIGDTTISQLQEYSSRERKPLFEVITEIDSNLEFSNAVRKKVGEFGQLIQQFAYDSVSMPFYDFVLKLVETLDLKSVYMTGKEEDESRWENTLEFLRHIKENYGETGSIAEFLQTIALSSADDDGGFDGDTITISTMHAVKGLEFKVVIIVACEEGILPSARNLSDVKLLEEERRVMYVAMTRAQERLFIMSVKGMRNRFGRSEPVVPSRFVSEAKGEDFRPKEVERSVERRGNYRELDAQFNSGIPSLSDMRDVKKFVVSDIENKPKVYNKSMSGFVSGAKVTHTRYGQGTILIVEGMGQDTMVAVAFPNLGIKKFSLMNAPLTLVN